MLFVENLVLLILVLLNIAFITLYERKILSFSQNRLGPNKVSFMGILQPMADAVKLFTKKETKPFSSSINIFYLSPALLMLLMFMIWASLPGKLNVFDFKFNYLYILMIMSLGVYPILFSGWVSNSSYSFIGSVRAIAQTISYEIVMAFVIIIFMILNLSMNVYNGSKFNLNSNFFLFYPLLFVWLLIMLAETNRTPFDFAEGESELVSGFNTEYSGAGFALLFMAEYGMIYFMSSLSANIFFPFLSYTLLSIVTLSLIFFWMWTRASLPRHRYDLLMSLAWKSLLPLTLSLILLTSSILLS